MPAPDRGTPFLNLTATLRMSLTSRLSTEPSPPAAPRELDDRLRPVAARLRAREVRHWMVGMVVFGGLLAAYAVTRPHEARAVQYGFGLLLLATSLPLAARLRRLGDADLVAEALEDYYPELDHRLRTLRELLTPGAATRTSVSPAVRSRLSAEVFEHAAAHDWAGDLVGPPVRLRPWGVGLGLIAVVIFGLLPWLERTVVTPRPAPASAAEPAPIVYQFRVSPGDQEVEKGEPVQIAARVEPAPTVPVVLAWGTDAGVPELLRMSPGLTAADYQLRRPPPTGNVRYSVRVGETGSPEYELCLFERPRLVRQRVSWKLPAYAGEPSTGETDRSELALPVGTELTWEVEVSAPLVKARIVGGAGADKPTGTFELARPTFLTATRVVRQTERLTWQVEDAGGRGPKDAVSLDIEAIPNAPPVVKFTFPGQDVRVSPLEEWTIEGQFVDDHGLTRHGWLLLRPGAADFEEIAPPSPEASVPLKESKATHRLELEPLALRPGAVLAVAAFAEDLDETGAKRRTTGPLYFAEVRPFEEITREIAAPFQASSAAGASSSQKESPLERMIESQRKILLGTWAVLHPKDEPAADTGAALTTLQKAQEHNAGELGGFREHIPPRLKVRADEATAAMWVAAKNLTDGAADSDKLMAAVAAEQSALSGLMELKPTEQIRMQGAGSGGGAGGGGSGLSEQDPTNLALSAEEDRPSQQATGTENAAAERQQLDWLDRLEELSVRQDEIRRQIQDFDAGVRLGTLSTEQQGKHLAALQQAQARLKDDAERLRQAVRQADKAAGGDELQSALDAAQSAVDQSLGHLKEGETAQAAAVAGQANDRLKQVQERLRADSALQLAERLRRLREQAADLQDAEDALAKTLREGTRDDQKSLRVVEWRQATEALVAKQQSDLVTAVDGLADLGGEYEATQPQVGRVIRTGLKQTMITRPQEALAELKRSLGAQEEPDWEPLDRRVQQSVGALAKTIDAATDAVLGNQVAALQQARQQLAALQDDIRKAGPGSGEGSGGQGEADGPGKGGDKPSEASQSKSSSSSAGGSSGGHAAGAASKGIAEAGQKLQQMEALVTDRRLKKEIAKIRQQAREMESELQRNSREPTWETLEENLVKPLARLDLLMAEEIRRQSDDRAATPLDRTPVPPAVRRLVQEYYQELGRHEE